MNDTRPHLKTLQEIEKESLPGLLEVLQKEGIDAVRYVLWNTTGWHRDYRPLGSRSRTTPEQKRTGWEVAVRIEKILCTILHEAHELQVE